MGHLVYSLLIGDIPTAERMESPAAAVECRCIDWSDFMTWNLCEASRSLVRQIVLRKLLADRFVYEDEILKIVLLKARVPLDPHNFFPLYTSKSCG